MTISEARDKVLHLFDDETTTTDYEARIYAMMDSVQTEILSTVKPVKKMADVTAIDGVITLPENCFEVVSVLTDELAPVAKRDIGDNRLQVGADGGYKLEYYAYAPPITGLDSEFSISQECQEALIYGVAAALTIDESMYDVYNAKYNNMLANIYNRRAERAHVTIMKRGVL